jgi:hypothetical protein
MSKRTAQEIGLGDDDRSIKKQKLEDNICLFDNLPIEALLTIFLWVPYEELGTLILDLISKNEKIFNSP